MAKPIKAYATGEFTRAAGAADWTSGYNGALVGIQVMLSVNYPNDPIARKIHAALENMHMTGDRLQQGDPLTPLDMFSVRRHNGPDDPQGETVGVYGTLSEAQQVADTLTASATFEVWQL
jgi:hypothetical protein